MQIRKRNKSHERRIDLKPLVRFLFRDDFITDEAADMTTPRAAEQGPGTATIKDTGSIASIDSSGLVYAGFTDGSDPSYSSLGFARVAGLTLYGKLDAGNLGVTAPVFGWARGANGVSLEEESLFLTAAINLFSTGPALNFTIGGYSANEIYEVALILRATGAFFVVRNPIDFPDWTLLWVTFAKNTTPLFANHRSGGTVVPGIQSMRVSQLSTPWDSDYGIATDRLVGARSAGETFSHDADSIIEFEVTTVPSGDQIEVRFRISDDTPASEDLWQVTIDSNGDIDLDEVVGGAVTQRGTAAGVIANGDRIIIICEDETIKVFEANVLRITYSSAATYKTESRGELETEGTGGSVSDIVSWPRRFSKRAKRALDNLVNA